MYGRSRELQRPGSRMHAYIHTEAHCDRVRDSNLEPELPQPLDLPLPGGGRNDENELR